MTKILKKIRLHYRKFKAKARKAGLNLSVAALILLSFLSIVSGSIFQSRTDTLFSRATTTCPAGVGTYMQLAGCEQVCAGNCKSCVLSTTTKYYCDIGDPGGGQDGGYGNLPTCKGYNTAIKSTCEKEFSSCTQCTNDGSSVRWHKGSGGTGPSTNSQTCTSVSCPNTGNYQNATYIFQGKVDKLYYSISSACKKKSGGSSTKTSLCRNLPDNPPTDEVQKCKTTNCNIFGIESHQSKTIYWGKEDGDYYLTERNCEKKKNSQLITELCPSTSNPSVSTDPENPEVSTPPANNECGSGIWIDNNGIEHDERKVPCTFSGCGEEDCENYQVKVTAGGSACCFQSAIGKCVPSSSCSSISYFTYPQEVVQEALSGIQTTIDGQQIDCDTNQCIPL